MQEVLKDFMAVQKTGFCKAMPLCPVCGARPVLFELYDAHFTNKRCFYQCKCALTQKISQDEIQAERTYYSAMSRIVDGGDRRYYLTQAIRLKKLEKGLSHEKD
ncbi:MAG: hypothetical protein ACTTH5_00130 [Wolinella sp.]